MRPLARTDGLVIRELGDEIVVYDRERQRAHCLNHAAASVFRLCDGERSPAEIAAMLDEGDGPAARATAVSLALEQLASQRLLVSDCADSRGGADEGAVVPAAGISTEVAVASRRELLRLAALAVPAIASIVAPTPAQAASGCIPLGACTPSDARKRCDPDGSGCTGPIVSCCNSITPGLCNDTSCF